MTARSLLVVDDDGAIRDSVRLAVTSLLGWQVHAACSGMEALEMVDDGLRPDMVLLDRRMPGLDGVHVAPLLRDRVGDVPIVMVSADGSGEARERALAAGCDGYVVKPFDAAELCQAVTTFL